jgi:hypothetical protein
MPGGQCHLERRHSGGSCTIDVGNPHRSYTRSRQGQADGPERDGRRCGTRVGIEVPVPSVAHTRPRLGGARLEDGSIASESTSTPRRTTTTHCAWRTARVLSSIDGGNVRRSHRWVVDAHGEPRLDVLGVDRPYCRRRNGQSGVSPNPGESDR